MKITLVDINEKVVKAWEAWFKCIDVEIVHGSIFDVDCECIVSPANSFGFMDGGLDLAISNKLGWHIQQDLMTQINEIDGGELLVGENLLVPTDLEHPNPEYLLAAPTMRVPMDISGTVNVYLATQGILDSHYVRNLSSIAIPGLGTGVGGMSPADCARQMSMAFMDFRTGWRPESWREAQRKHYQILGGNNGI